MITQTFIFGIAGSVISLLLLIIAYFLNRLLVKFDNMNMILEDVVLKTAIQNTTCVMSHKGVDARLNAHSEKIKEIENKLNSRK